MEKGGARVGGAEMGQSSKRRAGQEAGVRCGERGGKCEAGLVPENYRHLWQG